MMAEILEYLSVYALSGVKFIFGPTLGLSYGFSWIVTAILTACGMMTTVYLFIYFGKYLTGFLGRFKRRDTRVFTKRKRQFVKIWRNYGVMGIALVTPILLMPIGGAILVTVFGGKKNEIIFWMWVSALFHGFLQTWLVFSGFDILKSLF